ncbi:MAG TPA: MoaD/ThiS family protein [Nitrososphaerales archaeon]|nr:MoaD/ThiS family protein [Nitrososphaerales archaeon]
MIGAEEERKAEEDGQTAKRRALITFFGPIKSIVKRSSDEVTLSTGNSTVRDLIRILIERYGDDFGELVFHNEKINSGIVIFVDGERIYQKSDLEKKLRAESNVEVFLGSQAAGG